MNVFDCRGNQLSSEEAHILLFAHDHCSVSCGGKQMLWHMWRMMQSAHYVLSVSVLAMPSTRQQRTECYFVVMVLGGWMSLARLSFRRCRRSLKQL